MAEFISKNLEAANNRSDEEMEDVISELRKTGYSLFCEIVPVPILLNSGDPDYENIKLDSCQTIIPSHYW